MTKVMFKKATNCYGLAIIIMGCVLATACSRSRIPSPVPATATLILSQATVFPSHTPLSSSPTPTSAPPSAPALPSASLTPTFTPDEIRATEPVMTPVVKTPLASETAISVPLSGKIVFYSERDGNAEVYVMNPDGTNIRKILEHAGLDFEASWQP